MHDIDDINFINNFNKSSYFIKILISSLSMTTIVAFFSVFAFYVFLSDKITDHLTLLHMTMVFLLITFPFYLVIILFSLVPIYRVLTPIKRIMQDLQTTETPASLTKPEDAPKEILFLYDVFNNTIARLNTLQERVSNSDNLDEPSKFIARVAHDLRSPILALNACVKHFSNISEEQKELLYGATNRINDISKTLLCEFHDEITRTISCRDKRKTINSLSKIISDMLEEKKFIFSDASIELVFNISNYGFSSFLLSNESDMKIMLSNLLDNAKDACCKKHSKIVISLDATNHEIHLTITDNGCGIPPQYSDKVLTYGFSLKKNHTGLGLPAAKNIIESTEGKLAISSTINEGTTVRITLPRMETPTWFAKNITIKDDILNVAIINSTPSIIAVLHKRFSNAGMKRINLFNKPEDFLIQTNRTEKYSVVLFNSNEASINVRYLPLINYESEIIFLTPALIAPNDLYDHENSKIKILPRNLLEYIPILYSTKGLVAAT